MPTYKNVIVSPHLDDAYFSLGGMLYNDRHERQKVVDVFTVSEHEADDFTRGRHETTRARKAEEMINGRIIGADTVFLDELDAPLRGYQRVKVAPNAKRDRAMIARVEKRLANEIKGCKRVFFPLGIGGHVDHRIVHHMGMRLLGNNKNFYFYEDLPYAVRYARPRFDSSEYRARKELMPIQIFDKLSLANTYETQMIPRIPLGIFAHSLRVGRGKFCERVWHVVRV